MPDREKVIGLLQEMAEYFRECRSNASFASKAENHFWELQNAANEALALLREQEPVKPKRVICALPDWYQCGVCGVVMLDTGDGYRPKYCPQCGRKVKWDD